MSLESTWLRVAVGLFSLAAIAVAPRLGGAAEPPAARAASRRPPVPAPAVAPAAAVPGSAAAQPTFQAVDGAAFLAIVSPAQVLTMPVATQFASNFPVDPGSVVFAGLALDPTSGKVYLIGNDGTDSYLSRVDFTTGSQTTVGTLTGEVAVDLAFDATGHLYALTDNAEGTDHHALLLVNPANAAFSVAKIVDSHGGGDDEGETGAITFNPADQFLYYSNADGGSHLFVDKLAPGTFAQTPVLTTSLVDRRPTAMTFAQGRLWIACFDVFLSAAATNISAGLTAAGTAVQFPTLDGSFGYDPVGMFPTMVSCVPSSSTACIGNRFKVAVTYDATPANGSGPASVVLESAASVKFTFFDPGNIEVIVKLLNACLPPFNRWWVFAGGLTNVGVTIKVTDTTNGAVRSYSSSKGKIFQAFADTQAFTCP